MDFLYHFIPNRIMFSIFNINIYWYGFFIFCGAILGFLIFYKLAKKEKIQEKDIYDIFFYCFLFGIIGARLGYFFYDIQYYIQNPLAIFKFWEGGMSIIFGIISGVITLYIICKRRKIEFMKILNILPIPMLVAQILGRLGNYFNQELFGIPTSFFLKIPIQENLRPEQYKNETFFTPLFLYEIIFNIILLIILSLLLRKKYKNNLENGIISKELKAKDFRKSMNLLAFIDKGGIILIYINYYFILRFILEFFRIGEPKVLFLTLNQLLSIIVLVIFNIFWFRKNEKRA